MDEVTSDPAPGAREPAAPGDLPPSEPGEGREKEVSLGQKIGNLLEVARTTPRAEIKHRLEEGRHWRDQWEEYWLDCAQPLEEVVLLNLQKVLELGGNFYAAPGARRCGKTVLLKILKGLSECFSTPERPLPSCWYLNQAKTQLLAALLLEREV